MEFWIGIGVAMGLVAVLALVGGAMARDRSQQNWTRRDGGPWVPGEHDRFDDWR